MNYQLAFWLAIAGFIAITFVWIYERGARIATQKQLDWLNTQYHIVTRQSNHWHDLYQQANRSHEKQREHIAERDRSVGFWFDESQRVGKKCERLTRCVHGSKPEKRKSLTVRPPLAIKQVLSMGVAE